MANFIVELKRQKATCKGRFTRKKNRCLIFESEGISRKEILETFDASAEVFDEVRQVCGALQSAFNSEQLKDNAQAVADELDSLERDFDIYERDVMLAVHMVQMLSTWAMGSLRETVLVLGLLYRLYECNTGKSLSTGTMFCSGFYKTKLTIFQQKYHPDLKKDLFTFSFIGYSGML